MQLIAKALVEAQKAFGPALKTSTNPHFKSKYADLSACVEAVVDSLNNNGIALIQNCHESDTGVIVETVFLHESGETLSTGKLHVPASKQDPQGYGSALTYARRYSLMSACGIAPEDDDGNAASKGKATVTAVKANGTKNGSYKPAYNVLGQKPYKMDDTRCVSPDREEKVIEVIEKTLKWVNEKRLTDAVLEFENGNLEIEEKGFAWTFFDSTQRAAIKAEDQRQRALHVATQG